MLIMDWQVPIVPDWPRGGEEILEVLSGGASEDLVGKFSVVLCFQ